MRMTIEPSEQQLRAAARACFVNARDLYDEAALLQKAGRPARSAALAGIGLEEFGKAIVYLVAALAPDQRKALPPRLDGHEMKHRVCRLADAAQCMNEEGWAVDRQDGSRPSAQDRIVDMAALLVEWGITDLTDAKIAKQQHALLRSSREKQPLPPENPTRDIFLAIREPDLKNSALYVDLDAEGRPLTPARIEDHDARITIAGLEYFLAAYFALPEVVDETSWAAFASRVRGR
jgi:AbiV family abortive infection protein